MYLYNNHKNSNDTTVFHPALFIDNKYMIIFLIIIIGIIAAYLFITLEQIGFVLFIKNYFYSTCNRIYF